MRVLNSLIVIRRNWPHIVRPPTVPPPLNILTQPANAGHVPPGHGDCGCDSWFKAGGIVNWGGVLMPDETEPQFPPSNNGPQTPKRKSRLTSEVVDGMDLGGGGAVKPAASDSSAGSACDPAPVGGGPR